MKPPRKPLNARRVSAETVMHRGKPFPVVAEIDPEKSTITLHLRGCRKRKTYSLADLYTGKFSTMQMSFNF